MIRSVELPPPLAGERALYKRAISRSHAEWPLVEVCARAVVAAGSFQFIRIAAGGIAPVPLRLSASRSRLARQAGQRGEYCQRRKPGDGRREAAADDGIIPLSLIIMVRGKWSWWRRYSTRLLLIPRR